MKIGKVAESEAHIFRVLIEQGGSHAIINKKFTPHRILDVRRVQQFLDSEQDLLHADGWRVVFFAIQNGQAHGPTGENILHAEVWAESSVRSDLASKICVELTSCSYRQRLPVLPGER